MKKLSTKAISALIDRCRSGDERAWHRLIDFVGPYIFAICNRSQLTRDESFDVFGQVSFQLIKSIESLQDPARIFSFVGTITRREIYAFFQKINQVDHIDDEAAKAIPDNQSATPEEDIMFLDKRSVLMEAMSALPERDFKLMKMLYFDPEEPSYKTIAKKLGMPVSSVGPIRGKVLKKLYKLLKDKDV